jgi:hypothetical protein
MGIFPNRLALGIEPKMHLINPCSRHLQLINFIEISQSNDNKLKPNTLFSWRTRTMPDLSHGLNHRTEFSQSRSPMRQATAPQTKSLRSRLALEVLNFKGDNAVSGTMRATTVLAGGLMDGMVNGATHAADNKVGHSDNSGRELRRRLRSHRSQQNGQVRNACGSRSWARHGCSLGIQRV